MPTEGKITQPGPYATEQGACFYHPGRAVIACPDCIGDNYPHKAERLAAWQVALSFVGTPFEHAGRGRGGCDCAGPVEAIPAAMGWPWTFWRDYPPGFAGKPMEDALDAHMDRVDRVEDALPADVLLVHWRRGIDHLAVLGPDGWAVDASKARGVRKFQIDGHWYRRAIRAYRFRELSP